MTRRLRLPSNKLLLRLLRDIRETDKAAYRIVREHGITYARAHRLIAELRASPAPKHEPDKFVALVSEISKRFYGGRLPAPELTTAFVAACLTAFVPEEQPQQVRDLFAFNVTRALDCLRRQETGWMH